MRTSLIYGGDEPGPQERLARQNRRFFVDELRSPVQVGDLAEAILELLALDVPGPLHSAVPTTSRGSTSPCCSAPTPRGSSRRTRRPPRAERDARQLARPGAALTRLRGVHEVLA